MITYEDKLNRDISWALNEGGLHFERDSLVHQTLRRIAKRLDELGIAYALVGGMAMFFHGYRRFTEDVDLLVTREGLTKLHEELDGRGYVPPFEGSKNLRDTETGVRIEFLIAGHYPGDGKPKAVAFPDPSDSVELEGIQCVGLARLIELKLASGTAAWRRRDLSDVQDLIRTLKLPLEFAGQVDLTLRESFIQLWHETHEAPSGEI
ncbi:MAG: hypothetical protein WD768_19195 [Phycisphaeraceae bacterium]